MAVEDTFNGAKNGYLMLHAYTNTVAQVIGMEQALALATKMSETMGAEEGRMYKEQAGIEEFDTKAAYQGLNTMDKGVGILSEVIEESPQKLYSRLEGVQYTRQPRSWGWTPRLSRLIVALALSGSWRQWRSNSILISITN